MRLCYAYSLQFSSSFQGIEGRKGEKEDIIQRIIHVLIRRRSIHSDTWKKQWKCCSLNVFMTNDVLQYYHLTLEKGENWKTVLKQSVTHAMPSNDSWCRILFCFFPTLPYIPQGTNVKIGCNCSSRKEMWKTETTKMMTDIILTDTHLDAKNARQVLYYTVLYCTILYYAMLYWLLSR